MQKVTVNLRGGLGNQMFQYAMGFALAKKTGVFVVFDARWFKDPSPRPYELGIFDLDIALVKPHPAGLFVSLTPTRKEAFLQKFCTPVYRYARRLFPSCTRLLGIAKRIAKSYLSKASGKSTKTREALRYIQKLYVPGSESYRLRHFDSDLYNKISEYSYFYGYWQSEKYFEAYRDDIHTQFTFKGSLSPQSSRLREYIASENAVSMHIRRRDYITNKSANQYLGTPGIDYYKKACAYITSRVENPHFFVFSDDIAWAQDNIDFLPKVTFAQPKRGIPNHEYMQLMSLCQHNIIANSSFSWWGAWLNENEHKIVIAPKKWFADGTRSEDMIPENWIRL